MTMKEEAASECNRRCRRLAAASWYFTSLPLFFSHSTYVSVLSSASGISRQDYSMQTIVPFCPAVPRVFVNERIPSHLNDRP